MKVFTKSTISTIKKKNNIPNFIINRRFYRIKSNYRSHQNYRSYNLLSNNIIRSFNNRGPIKLISQIRKYQSTKGELPSIDFFF